MAGGKNEDISNFLQVSTIIHTSELLRMFGNIKFEMTQKFWPWKYVMFGIKMMGSIRLNVLRHFQPIR